MRRKPKPEKICRRVWPIFIWRFCHQCGDDVRREWVWKFQRYSFRGFNSIFICMNCARDQESADGFAHRFIRKPPTALPPRPQGLKGPKGPKHI